MVALVTSTEGTSLPLQLEELSLLMGTSLESGNFLFDSSVLMRKLHGCMRNLCNHSRQMILLVAKRLYEVAPSILVNVQNLTLKAIPEVGMLI
jgi:hypothetical protein